MISVEDRGGDSATFDADRHQTGLVVVVAVGMDLLKLHVKTPAWIVKALRLHGVPVGAQQLRFRIGLRKHKIMLSRLCVVEFLSETESEHFGGCSG